MGDTSRNQAKGKLEKAGAEQMKEYLQDIYADVNNDQRLDRPGNGPAEKISAHGSNARRFEG